MANVREFSDADTLRDGEILSTYVDKQLKPWKYAAQPRAACTMCWGRGAVTKLHLKPFKYRGQVRWVKAEPPEDKGVYECPKCIAGRVDRFHRSLGRR